MSDPVAEATAALSAAQSSAEPSLLEQAMDTIHSLEAKVEHLIHPDTQTQDMSSIGQMPMQDGGAQMQASVGEAQFQQAINVNAGAEAGVAMMGEQSSSLSSGDSGLGEAGNVDATTLLAGAATAAGTGNVLLNAAPIVDAPVINAPAVAEVIEPLPRESHLLLLDAKIAAFRAKLANAERVALDEFESIVGHVRAVL